MAHPDPAWYRDLPGTARAPPRGVGASVLDSDPDRVGSWMQRRFVEVSPRERVGEVRELMRLGRVRHLLVVQDGLLVGLVSYRDLLEARLAAELARASEVTPKDRLDDADVSSVMVPVPVTITPSATLREAAACMLRLHLGVLPVVEEGIERSRPIGIMTESDLLRAAYITRPRAG